MRGVSFPRGGSFVSGASTASEEFPALGGSSIRSNISSGSGNGNGSLSIDRIDRSSSRPLAANAGENRAASRNFDSSGETLIVDGKWACTVCTFSNPIPIVACAVGLHCEM
jgi:hypothetical protein